jgi:alcohol dehydrogenase class IV
MNTSLVSLFSDNVLFGCGKIENLPQLLRTSKKILIFISDGLLKKLKIKLKNILTGFDILFYTNFSPNPDQLLLDYAVKNIKESFDTIIAIGGGSTIDFSKLYIYFKKMNVTFVTIPTTAGTGSEATKFAACYNSGKKYSVEDESILPNYVLIDPDLLKTSPKYLRSCTAVDALAQSIESYWSVNSTDESKIFATKSILLCLENIVNYVNINDIESAEHMAIAAYLSGRAINISKTTAAHALSYAFTINYNIPHGHAVALSIANLFNANKNTNEVNCVDTRGVSYVKKTICELEECLGQNYFNNLFLEIELETNLKKLGIKNIEHIIKEVNIERLKNNPRTFSLNELKALFQYQ